ncbi:MAG: antibiotic biosynthesis monooxygenase, partial [Desulfobacterales bacterium]
MGVLIIIKRVFRMDQTKQLVPLLKELRAKAEKQSGFISRTTYSKLNDPGELVVVMEWETVDTWLKWMDSE